MELWRLSIYLLCVGLLGGCSTPPERQDVPVLAGITLNEECQLEQLVSGLELFDEFGLEGWLLEFPMYMHPIDEASDFRYYEKHTLDTIIHVFKSRSYPYSLAFNLENPKNYPTARINLTNYLLDISAVLLRTQAYPPSQLVFMGEFLNSDIMEDKLSSFIENIRSELSGFKGQIVYAMFPYQFDELNDWTTPDRIGVRYHESPEEDLRKYYFKINRAMSKHLSKHEKEVFIAQSNLMGEDKLEIFKNQLRFWENEVELSGIVLNSLNCKMALTDTGAFFALGEDDAFKDFLRNYLDE